MQKKYFVGIILIAAFIYAGSDILNPFFKADTHGPKIMQTHESTPPIEEKSRSEYGPDKTRDKVLPTTAASKNEESFEPHSLSRLDANELLDRKNAEDPEEELKGMHHPDQRAGEGRMLLGKFFDEKNKIELFLALAGDDETNHACLVSPALSFKEKPGTYGLSVDASGYGIVKFNETYFLRVTWFIDDQRFLLGRLFKIENGKPLLIKEFSAAETSTLTQCK